MTNQPTAMVRASTPSRSQTRSPTNANLHFARMVHHAAAVHVQNAIKQGRLRVVTPCSTIGEFTPRMDICDDASSNRCWATFEIPGVKSSDLSLNVREGSLVLKGQRRPPRELRMLLESSSRAKLPSNPITDADVISSGETEPDIPKVNFPTRELRYGTFTRTIPLPSGIKESDMVAQLEDGLLTVTWPRTSTNVVPTGTDSDASSGAQGGAAPPATNLVD